MIYDEYLTTAELQRWILGVCPSIQGGTTDLG
jgi:hypothetical protein